MIKISPSSSPSPIKGEGTIYYFILFSLAPPWEKVRVRGLLYTHCDLFIRGHFK